ncbi:MAG: Cro/CI family transcriptional regulator [Hyphomicrobium sp.]
MARPPKRDAGLEAAIHSAGSICQLARLLGLSQPTVSVWRRVPPHRVIQIEALTGVSRRILRPDLYDVPEPPIVKPREAGVGTH